MTEAIDPDVFAPEDAPGDDEQLEHFRIDGLKTADWAMRKLAKLRKQAADNSALADEEIALVTASVQEEVDRITDWVTQENDKLRLNETYFAAILKNWHEEQLAEDDKAKTISLPSGKLVARKTPDRIEVDEEAFLPWATAHRPEWVQTIHKPVKTEIKKALTAGLEATYDTDSGDEVPGVEIIPGAITYKQETQDQ